MIRIDSAKAAASLRRSLLRLATLSAFLAASAGCGIKAMPAPNGGSTALAALNLGLLGPSGQNPIIVGHRGGASGKAPENTMAAFRLGPSLGAAVLECDVHCSKDGALVVIHDKSVDRTTNGKGPVHQFTLAQLKQLDAGNGERIPTLEELLAFVASQPAVALTIEIKAKRKICPDIADKVLAAVNKAGLASRVMIISFHRDAVEKVEQLQPALPTGLLFLLRLNPIKTGKAIHTDMLWSARQRTTTHFVQAAHDAKFSIFSWTLDAARYLLDARRVGVDAVVTDIPDVAREVFQRGDTGLPAPGGDASASTDPEDQEDPDDLADDDR